MTDRDFLIWLHQRLVEVHGESSFMDYMHFLRDIIHTTPKGRRSRGRALERMVVRDEVISPDCRRWVWEENEWRWVGFASDATPYELQRKEP